jgi:amidase
MPTTEPEVYGPTHNPWDTNRSPGGSSGGSAAAVASGMVAIAHGNDGGGSIRIPSSACGLVGLKPSRGRNSLGPEFGEIWAGLVAEHVLTRSVRDSAAILDATAGAGVGDPYYAPPPQRPFTAEVGAEPGSLHIGLLTRAPAHSLEVHPDCVAAARDAAQLLESLGHRVEETHPAALDDPEFGLHFGGIVSTWINRELHDWAEKLGRPVTADHVETLTWALAEMGKLISTDQYIQTVTWLHRFTRRVASWWEDGFDLLLTPTLAEPPPPLGAFAPTPENPLNGLLRSIPIAAFTSLFNATGQPAVSLPLYWNGEGLPIGTQLVADYGREDLLFRVASQLEVARPWVDRWPPES